MQNTRDAMIAAAQAEVARQIAAYMEAQDTDSLDRPTADMVDAFYRYNAVRLGLVRTA